MVGQEGYGPAIGWLRFVCAVLGSNYAAFACVFGKANHRSVQC